MADERKKDTRYRPRLAIPESDEQVIEWMQTQSDLSNSIRRLVRDSIRRQGMVDIDCLPVTPGVHPGRPRRQAGPQEYGAGGVADGPYEDGNGELPL